MQLFLITAPFFSPVEDVRGPPWVGRVPPAPDELPELRGLRPRLLMLQPEGGTKGSFGKVRHNGKTCVADRVPNYIFLSLHAYLFFPGDRSSHVVRALKPGEYKIRAQTVNCGGGGRGGRGGVGVANVVVGPQQVCHSTWNTGCARKVFFILTCMFIGSKILWLCSTVALHTFEYHILRSSGTQVWGVVLWRDDGNPVGPLRVSPLDVPEEPEKNDDGFSKLRCRTHCSVQL